MAISRHALTPALLAIALLITPPSFADAPRDLRPWLDGFHERAAQKPAEQQSRELTYAALVTLTAGDNPKMAEDYLRRAYDTQEMDRSSKTYGQLRWLVGDADPITDFNCIEFNSVPLGAILNGYREKLSAEFEEYLTPHLQASLDALRAHNVKVSYTNIRLMNAESLILLGQATKDDAAIAEGKARLDAWIAYTKQNGIHEFDCPGYYGVDLSGLMRAYHYTADPETGAKFKMILDYFWTDIAANYFAPGERIAGPYARDYDFLSGTGHLDEWLRVVGWAPGTPAATIAVVDDFNGSIYQPPAAAVELAHSGPRMVMSRWDDNPGHMRYAWLGKSISMGCTSGNYEPQDKLFAVTFAGQRDMPQISLVVDTYDSPYGQVKRKDKTNHSKPWHQDGNFASAQEGGMALITLDIDPSKIPAKSNGLATNLVIPVDAAIALDGAVIDLSSPKQIDVKPSAILTAAANGGTFAIRLIRIDPLDDRAPQISLCSDEPGLAHHAVRLELGHLPSGQTSRAEHLRLVLLAAVDDTDQPAALSDRLRHAVVDDEVHGDTWQIRVSSGDVQLEVNRSMTDARTIVAPKTDDGDAPRSTLSVNNADLASRIWEPK